MMRARMQTEKPMAYDEGHAEILRELLSGYEGISERKMFGGLCFMLNGNMMCGVHKDGGMFRVGKDNEAAALNVCGVDPLSFTGRKMGGMVDISAETIADDEALATLLALADRFVGQMPPK
jgi:TfoX/Sxy family transcriptional regulator of competence genes